MKSTMDWKHFKPTKEILEYESKLRESVAMREKLKNELEQLQHKQRDLFWEVECKMLETGIRYYDTCAGYYVCKAENEYIMAEIKMDDEAGSENCQDL